MQTFSIEWKNYMPGSKKPTLGKEQRKRTQTDEDNGMRTEQGQANEDKDFGQDEWKTQTLEPSKNIFNLTHPHPRHQSTLDQQTVNNMNTFAIISLTFLISTLAMETINFRQKGTLFPTHGIIHMHQIVNLSMFHETCQKMVTIEKILEQEARLESLFDQAHLMTLKDTMNNRRENYLKLQHLIIRRKATCDSIPNFIKQHQRQKRGFLAVLGTIFGWFGLTQLTNLLTGNTEGTQHQLATLHNGVKDNLNAIRLLQENEAKLHADINAVLRHIDLRLSFTQQQLNQQNADNTRTFYANQLFHLERTAQQLLTGLIQALLHKLSPDFIDPLTLTNNFKKLETIADQMGGKLPLLLAENVYQLPTSAMIDAERQLVHVFTHIPLLPKTTQPLDIFILAEEPIILSFEKQLLANVDTDDLIATNSDLTQYTILTQHALRSCIKIEAVYFCPNVPIYNDFSTTCLAKLFKNDLNDLQLWCPLNIWTQTWSVYPDGPYWKAFSFKPIPYHIICQNGTKTQHILHQPTKILLEPQCQVISNLFSLPSAPLQIRPSELFTNNIQPEFFLPQQLLNFSESILSKISNFRSPTTHLHNLLHIAQTTQYHETNDENVHSFIQRTTTIQIALGSGLAIWTIALLYCMIKGKILSRKRKQKTNPVQ